MESRHSAVATAGTRNTRRASYQHEGIIEEFEAHVFHRGVMEKMLTRQVYQNVVEAIEGREPLEAEHADAIAAAMKEWAVSHGATHYCHWFQPLTGAAAEKHDSFIDWSSDRGVIETFSGKQLVQGEPDASSFPSGGLRATWEARGYTGWDPSSPAFLWKGGDGITLCIPSVFFSWTGHVLDFKIPLHRSEDLLNGAVMRMLRLCGVDANRAFTTLGWEQEYFIVDRALRNQRPDLVMLGKTVIGASSPKGQELQDHYFGAVKDRILSYMKEFELEALRLGIPVKTRHNEVAPAQHEVAPVFERTPVAVDHNILLMELMRQVAVKHQLACLLHEKPFAELNGSGKHNNWSVATDTGINLLDPTDHPENSLGFLILLTAVLEGVYQHADLLLASIASAGNDCRLGGHEAPPSIISVFLGQTLEGLLESIEKTGHPHAVQGKEAVDLGALVLPDMSRDDTDRNRTSPFAFTGNRFEFRAVGSMANCSFPMTVLNVAVARSLDHLLDEIDNVLKGARYDTQQELMEAVLPVLQSSLKRSRPIRFTGDNYTQEWVEEAARRQLPRGTHAVGAFEALRSREVISAFEGILTADELGSRYEILMETYSNTMNIEAKLLVDLFQTFVRPAVLKTQSTMANALHWTREVLDPEPPGLKSQKDELRRLVEALHYANQLVEKVAQARAEADPLMEPDRARSFVESVLPVLQEARRAIDALEEMVDDQDWSLPKYRELLFMV